MAAASDSLQLFSDLAFTSHDYPEQVVFDDMFPRQRDFADSEERMRAIICSRRAGKTELLARMCLDSMGRYPGEDQYTGYVTLTKGTSQRNIEGILDELIARYDLPITPTNKNGQRIYKHANGHNLWIGGADSKQKADRFRGNKWRLFIVDEAGTFAREVIRYLVEDVMWPALTDLDGTIILSGTPGPLEEGFFWEITTGEGRTNEGKPILPWPTWHWTLKENPYHPAFKSDAFLADLRRRRGWDITTPTYMREYLGLWATDRDAIVYTYDRHRHNFEHLPALRTGQQWRYILTVDVGQRDKTAFTVAASCHGSADLWVMESFGDSEMTIAQREEAIKAIERRYPIEHKLMDPGGGGAMLIEDYKTRGIWMEGAEKKSKAAGIRLVQDALQSSPPTLHIRESHCEQLVNEWRSLTWNKDRTDHDPNVRDDLSDSLIYNYRAHDLRVIPYDQNPPPGTPEWRNLEGVRDKERTAREAEIMAKDWPAWKKNRALRSLSLE